MRFDATLRKMIMSLKRYALLSLAALLVLAPAQAINAQPPRQMSPPALAAAPGNEPYGWWYSKTPDPFSRGGGAPARTAAMVEGARQGAPESQSPPHGAGASAEAPKHPQRMEASADSQRPPHGPQASAGSDQTPHGMKVSADSSGPPQGAGHPAGNGEGAEASQQKTAAQPAGNMPMNHSFAMNRSPVQSLYLAVVGADVPETAPEVYYRFTARTLERHGGVALGSSWHQGKVVRDGETWRADLFGASFGTVEIYSRFRLGDRYVYSQHNYLHFIRAEDSEGLKMPERVDLPADWPQIVFPTSSYNDMPFRGIQAGQTVEFQLEPQPGQAQPASALVLAENTDSAVKLDYSSMSKKFSYTPEEDEQMAEAGARGSKKAVVMVGVPGSGDLITFSFNVNRSRWSTRKLGLGLGGMAAVGAVSATTVIRRRRRFKYNDRD